MGKKVCLGKKSFVLVLVFICTLLLLTACGSSDSKEEGNSPSVEKDTIKIGMELKWAPFEMTNTEGNPEGISVLIAEELGKYLGKKVEIVDLPFTTLIPALETEKIDLILSSMSITEDRKEKINFSEPYMYFKLLAAVNKESGLKTREEVFKREGVRFVAPKSFSSLELARKHANNPKILEFDDKATASLELANGNADVFVVDAITAVGISKTYPDNVEVIDDPMEISPIGVGLRKTDTQLLEDVNAFISKMDELGINQKIKEQYDEILKEKVGKTYEFYSNEN